MSIRRTRGLRKVTPLLGLALCFSCGTGLWAADEPAPAGDDPPSAVDDATAPRATLRKLPGNILADQKRIWTSPFHTSKGDAKWWLIWGGVTAALMATDHTTVNTFSNGPTQIRWGNRLSDLGSTYTLVPIVVGFYAAGIFTDDAKARETGLLAGEALVDSAIVGEVFKVSAGRKRPNSGSDRQEFFDGGASFPSGHSLAAWSLASVVAHEYGNHKWVPVLAYSFSTVVSAARFTAQQHYLSDVVAGAGMGWFIGRSVYQRHGDPALRRHDSLTPRVAPLLYPSSGTYGLSLTWNGTH